MEELYINIICAVAGMFAAHFLPKLKNGFQKKDVAEAVDETKETIATIKALVNEVESVIDDPKINNDDTVKVIKTLINAKK